MARGTIPGRRIRRVDKGAVLLGKIRASPVDVLESGERRVQSAENGIGLHKWITTRLESTSLYSERGIR